MNYTEMPADVLQFIDSRYFITEYSMTYPTEDRAKLMESAMNNFTWDFAPGSGQEQNCSIMQTVSVIASIRRAGRRRPCGNRCWNNELEAVI
jgi:hypothetical protein